MRTIERHTLPQAAAAQIRARILSGDLAPGERLHEEQLAEELGISRTPLRESLLRLEGEGFVERPAGRGCRVRTMSVEEVREIYPIRATLEVLALRSSGPPASEELRELAGINRELESPPRNAAESVDLDEAFHRRLIGHASNRRLLTMVASLAARCRRYEYAYFAAGSHRRESAAQHAAILDALSRGDLDRACEQLERNLVGAVPDLVDWLAHGGADGGRS